MLNVKLEKTKGKYVTITAVNTVTFTTHENRVKNKIDLSFSDEYGRMYRASDVWTKNRGIKPLYCFNNNSVQETETLGQLLVFLNVNSTSELVGKRIYVYPDQKNFLVPVCFDEKLVQYICNDHILTTENVVSQVGSSQ